ncbi:LytR C-terminal domain-containing protein [Corynebacterium axilliensis]|uniref:LytR C-terminal domain-containing protein n=1 Tax=Corynebacterium sp. YSMAA5_1_F9 TaxID=3383591 RepID=UPI0038D0600C
MTNVNPDNSDSTTPRGPRHAAKPAEPEAATATAAGAASGAKGGAAASTNSANSAAPASSASSAGTGKLPLRGVAMVLIAVAVMLGMWALYSLTSDKDDSAAGDGSGTGDATVSAPATGGVEGGEPGSAAEHGSQDQAGNGADGAQDGDKPGQDGAAGEEQDGDSADSTGDSAAENGAAGQGGNAAGNREQADIPVNVYNNSARINYAADEAERLKSENFKVSEVGNLSGDVFTAPQTTIYFPEGDAAAENLAKEVAAQYYGGSVPAEALAPYPAELKGDYTKGDAVVVVLAVPQA